MDSQHQTQSTQKPPSFTPVNGAVLQRQCVCGQSKSADGECSACKQKQLQLQRSSPTSQTSSVPPLVHDILGSVGSPLVGNSRRFMESRFQRDFSQVRLHTDSKAAQSADAVGAHAYTAGQHIVFGAGRYAPNTMSGAQLLAHELVHTQQQKGVSVTPASSLTIGPANDVHEREADRLSENALSIGKSYNNIGMSNVNASAAPRLQRACGPRAIGRPVGCSPFGGVSTTDISSHANERFLFEVNCDDFRPGEEARLRALAGRVGAAAVVDIHGFASDEGPADYNEQLACARAKKAEQVLLNARVPARQIRALYKHGATAGHRPENRSVVIPLTAPPNISVLPAGFIGPPSLTQRRAAATCAINCGGRNIGTLNAMGLFHHTSRTGIVAAGSAAATGIGTALHFTATAVNIPKGNPCHCDNYRIIQILDTTHPAPGRGGNRYVDNAGHHTPFYGDVGRTGTGIHQIPAGYPDAGNRIQSTRSIYDRPYRTTASLGGTNLRWQAESCVACVKNHRPDRILGCATYGFRRTYNAATHSYGPVVGIAPGCLAAPTAAFLNTLRNDPTVAAYQFEGK